MKVQYPGVHIFYIMLIGSVVKVLEWLIYATFDIFGRKDHGDKFYYIPQIWTDIHIFMGEWFLVFMFAGVVLLSFCTFVLPDLEKQQGMLNPASSDDPYGVKDEDRK